MNFSLNDIVFKVDNLFISCLTFLEYEIKEDCNGEYFEYGRFFEKIYFNDFEEVKEMI